MASDDPTEFGVRVQQLADTYTVLGKQDVAVSVKALFQIAADTENPLAQVALVAIQVMASVYNERMGIT